MIFDLVLSIFLLLSPIIFTSFGFAARYQWYQFGYFSNSINLLQLQFFQYGTVMLFLVALFSKPKRLFQDKYFGILFALCIWSVFLHPKTIQNFYNIFLGFLLYYLVVTYTKNAKSILKVVVIVATLNTLFAILQFFHINLIYYPKADIIGLMSYKSQLGIYQALALPICYTLNPYLSIIPLIGLLLSKSVTAIIPAIIGMAYLFRKKISNLRFSYIYFMVFITSLIFLCIKSFNKLSLRFDVWVVTLQMIFKKWLYGYGIGTFKYINSKHIQYDDPYGLYLGVTYALGILGIIALILFLKDKFIRIKNNALIAQGLLVSCLILVLCGFGYSFLDYPRLAGTIIPLFAFLEILKRKENYEN